MTTALLALAAGFAGAVLGALGLYAVAFSLRKKSETERLEEREQLKGQFASVCADVLSGASDQLLKLAGVRFTTDRQAVESVVRNLEERLKSYEELMRSFEADRQRKYGSLEEQLRKATQTTEALQSTTEKLKAALSNSRTRGQWGERMAEDILRASGLIENIQYVKNKAQDTVATRPDFAFLLPEGHKLHMDVKFPLDNYLRLVNAVSEEERERAKGDFLKDVKARIKEVQKRDYVNPEEKTLGYVLLFIPNEQIYGFIQEAAPGLIDEAMAQKVVLTSPSSLYAVLGVVRQAFENFNFTQATQEIVKLISSFSQVYEKFKERFGDLGERLRKSLDVYEEITQTSYKRLDQAIARIEGARRGPPVEPPLELPILPQKK